MIVAALTIRYRLDVRQQTHKAIGLLQGTASGGRIIHVVRMRPAARPAECG
jgi:hypothetical protein